MSAVFLVQLDAEGLPEPMFCSVCGEWREWLVFFPSENVEVSMCNLCIREAGMMLVNLKTDLAASQD